MFTRMQDWARVIRSDVVTLWLAARDPRVPLAPKLLAAFVAAYALSPIDLIPDFIPVLGLIDDLVIVPLGVLLALRMIPAELRAELRSRAEAEAENPGASWVGAAIVALVWLIGIGVLIGVFLRQPSLLAPLPA